MVHTTCDCVYVFIFSAGMRFPDSSVLHFQDRQGGRDAVFRRYACVYRHGFPYFRNAFGIHLGEGGMGTFLELGSEGDMGAYHMAFLRSVYTFEIV